MPMVFNIAPTTSATCYLSICALSLFDANRPSALGVELIFFSRMLTQNMTNKMFR